MKNNVEKKSIVRKKKIKLILISFLFVLFTIGLIVSLLEIFFWSNDNKNILKLSDDISKNTDIKMVDDDKSTEIIEDESLKNDKNNVYWQFIKMPLIDVDIEKLIEQNDDTVGWINVNNTNINYPFMQTNDNKYYLTHAFDKSWNDAGWLFLDYRNNYTNNKNTIIYAHGRNDQTMFGSLRTVLTKNWLSNTNNYVIKISTEKENSLWQIFSTYHIPTTSDYLQTNFESDIEYQEFLDMIKNRSSYNFNTSVNSNDNILTLSTCYNNSDKMVVHAKLIKKE